MLWNKRIMRTKDTPNAVAALRRALHDAESVVIGAGAGLSTAAGFVYSGERFGAYLGDFGAKYGFRDMYSGGFYPYRTPEEMWAFWSRNIYINRYMNPPKPVYEDLYRLVRDKDYFVLTTNVDHCFQKAGFAKERLYYTQGDYGLFQCSEPCHDRTYDNAATVERMLEAQGFVAGADGRLAPPKNADGTTDYTRLTMQVPGELVPYCPVCGRPMSMNLRADDTFVQDDGWYAAAERYETYLEKHRKRRLLFLELGTGFNTPGIVKYSFWRMTKEFPAATYACINYGEAGAPEDILDRSICINEDIGAVLDRLD